MKDNLMTTRCDACKYGRVNSSKKFECWRFDHEDENDPFHIEMRERHAVMYNRTECFYFRSAEESKENKENKENKTKNTKLSLLMNMLKK